MSVGLTSLHLFRAAWAFLLLLLLLLLFCQSCSKPLLIRRHESGSFIHIDIINEEAGSLLYQLTPQGKVKLASSFARCAKVKDCNIQQINRDAFNELQDRDEKHRKDVG